MNGVSSRAEALRWFQLGFQAGVTACRRQQADVRWHAYRRSVAEFQAERLADQQARYGADLTEVIAILGSALLTGRNEADDVVAKFGREAVIETLAGTADRSSRQWKNARHLLSGWLRGAYHPSKANWQILVNTLDASTRAASSVRRAQPAADDRRKTRPDDDRRDKTAIAKQLAARGDEDRYSKVSARAGDVPPGAARAGRLDDLGDTPAGLCQQREAGTGPPTPHDAPALRPNCVCAAVPAARTRHSAPGKLRSSVVAYPVTAAAVPPAAVRDPSARRPSRSERSHGKPR
jgi:hypothetical protein